MRAVVLAIAVAAVAGCRGGGGDDGGEAPPAPVVHPIATTATAASPDDVIVAKVAGRPVWGSCVTAQAVRGAPTKQTALDQCIAFELMAQEAERRGLAPAASTDDGVRAALVNRLVETGFEATHTTPESLGDVMTKWLSANAWRMHRPELRASSYARVLVAQGAPPDQDAAAKALAEQIAAALANETGLFGVNLRETANRLAAGSKLKIELADAPVTQKAKLDPSYGEPLFALPDVGRATGAVRTPWGWDVIVLTGIVPPQELTLEQLSAGAFVELRRVAFGAWVNALVKELHVKITIDPDQVQKLESGSS